MISETLLFIKDIDELQRPLFRSGNATSPNFSENRALKDLLTFEKNGVVHVRANGNGFSTFSYITEGMKLQGKNVWIIIRGARLPESIRLVHDRTPGKRGHYMLAPEKDMPLMKYLGLLQELGADPGRCRKLSPVEIKDGKVG
jgi:hypothetical protein